MKFTKAFLLFVALLVMTFIGCEDRSDLTAPAPVNTGSVSFARFVSLGNSITAGYQSGALYESASKYSFGALLAKQVGAGYVYPVYTDPGTGNRIEVASISPFATKVNTAMGTYANQNYAAPFNNLGVPGATAYDIIGATSSTTCFQAINGGGPNPMFDIVLRGLGSAFSQAKSLNPTFLTVWIGNNDILGYATSGGTKPYTPTSNFQAFWTQLADSLASLNTKVVVANIPNVTSIPFFTTVGGQLMLGGVTKVWAVTSTGDTQYVSLSQNLITLQGSSLVAGGTGFAKAAPLPNSVVLDSGEVATAIARITEYNAHIQSLASAKGFGYVDFNALLVPYANAARTGTYVTVDGLKLSTVYVTGNLFSLDGVHPSNVGAALIANEFINVINAKWGASIPKINLASIPGGLVLGKNIQFGKYGLPIFPAGTFDNLQF